MKKIITILFLAITLLFTASCGSTTDEKFTIAKWIENKGGSVSDTLEVKIDKIENPVWAIVSDSSNATVHLFGVYVDGEFKDFESAGITEGDTIVISAGTYNEFEGTIEIKEANLIEKKSK